MSIFASDCKQAMNAVQNPHNFAVLLMIWPSCLLSRCPSQKVLCLTIPCAGSYAK